MSLKRKCKFCARSIPSPRRNVLHGELLARIAVSQTILQCVAKHLRKKVLSVECESEDEEYEHVAEIEFK